MAEKRTPVSLVRVDLECEACEEGTMKRTGVMLTSNPPQYEHACDKCGTKLNSVVGYPHYSYEEI